MFFVRHAHICHSRKALYIGVVTYGFCFVFVALKPDCSIRVSVAVYTYLVR